MNGKALIPLIAGLGIGGFALWMGFKTLKAAHGSGGPAPAKTVEVLCAQTDIPRLNAITEEMIETKSYPANAMPEGAFTKAEELLGRVPKVEAPAGLPILESMLLPPGARGGLYVKPGYRAVAVRIDAGSGVDYHLEPGAFVDVLGSFTVSRRGRQETLATTVLENVEIAAVGPRLSPGTTEGGNGQRAVRAVTLFVKPNEVPRLLLAEQRGRIKLGLRSDQDAGRLTEVETISDRVLTGQSVEEPQPAPAVAGEPSWLEQLSTWWAEQQPRLAAATDVPDNWTMRIVRGNKAETVEFSDDGGKEEASSDASEKGKPNWEDELLGDADQTSDGPETWEPEELKG